MKRIRMKMILLSLGIAMVVLMGATECVCSFENNSYSAKVVNIKPTDSTNNLNLDDAVISLYAYNSADGSYSTTAAAYVEIEGDTTDFTLFAPVAGRYKIDGSKNGWTFVPIYVEINSSGVASQDLYAYPSVEFVDNSEYAAEYTIIARWAAAIDTDLELTYGDAAYSGSPTVWDIGTAKAGPAEDGIDGRVKIGPQTTSLASTGSRTGIKYHGDATSTSETKVETISIYNSDWLANTNTIKVYVSATNGDGDPLLTGNQFAPTSSDETYPAAFLQVDVMRRYDSDFNGILDTDAHYGTWYVPYNTYESIIHLFTATFSSAGSGSLTFASANVVNEVRNIITE